MEQSGHKLGVIFCSLARRNRTTPSGSVSGFRRLDQVLQYMGKAQFVAGQSPPRISLSCCCRIYVRKLPARVGLDCDTASMVPGGPDEPKLHKLDDEP
jgi:hypothetical protein